MSSFSHHESNVRSYSRRWPVVFSRSSGSHLYSEEGRRWLDFFAGAGSLNYGHNNPVLKRALLDYIDNDGVTHALDMFTTARHHLLKSLVEVVLQPRGLDHKVIFPGPGGANAVEAALKLARTVTGRSEVVHFTNSFHGATLGALAVTGNPAHRRSAGLPLTGATPVPFDGQDGPCRPEHLARLLANPGSGLDRPAAVIVETVQAEGGVNVAGAEWLRGLAELCREHGILLIVDDIQAGCGRTGPFFSFEDAGIVPDVICLSKSIGGYGLPLALTLVRPELDVWQPGAHSGTFRGVNPAFVTATAALRAYWQDDALEKSTRARGEWIANALQDIVNAHPGAGLSARGRGLIHGLVVGAGLADAVADEAFTRGLLVETAGPRDEVVKLLPPLTASDAELAEGLAILEASVRGVVERAR
ncbi:diaminobutyrate--2-oxoglutarate transaminase [Streptomyces sp. TRM S81-3]|uniref:Diaminobutyrate--2-oxoglutarate transaminase n=1 Tax=Streptomyces griseicoloratus TaxID=2752516 RepID=A0A926L2M1_9ACTN|nr:diaminobutyrate--2-oxoglutarate transaminase [Streptomyces griseicoloratus]MBD0420481.1 diaminobutyrate--2-oxoglutarate transaminase [Streptomyces griseicoloratus]